MKQLVCPRCAQHVQVHTKLNFLGFPKFRCPACDTDQKHPLSTVRAVIYWIIAALSVAWAGKILAAGELPIVGILPALVIAAVVIDLTVRSNLKGAKRRAGV